MNSNVLPMIAVAFVIVLALLGIIYLILKVSVYDSSIRVTATEWRRSIETQQFQTLQKDENALYMPSDAYDVHTYAHATVKIVYGTAYRQGANGQQESYITTTVVPDTETWARYKVNRWCDYQILSTSGKLTEEHVWPAFKDEPAEVLGNIREATRYEKFFVCFIRLDNDKVVEREVPSGENAGEYPIGQAYDIKINHLEEPRWKTLTAQAA